MRDKIIDQKGLNYITITIVDWIDLFLININESYSPKILTPSRNYSLC